MLKPDNNIAHVRTVARALGDLREDLVFVGGSVAGLLLSDPLAAGVRATIDVDAVTDSNRASLLELEQAIQTRGFIHDVMSGVICRWIHKESGVVFDLMPVDPHVLGFTNPWYAYAVQSAQMTDIGDGLRIKVVSAPAFIATKIEAFKSRGNSDFLTSHDFEDILNVVDGRPELIEELVVAPKAVQQLVAELFGGLLAKSDFINTLPGLLPEPDRYEVVLQRLSEMAKL